MHWLKCSKHICWLLHWCTPWLALRANHGVCEQYYNSYLCTSCVCKCIHNFSLCCIPLHCITWRHITLQNTTWLCITLHHITRCCITLHYIACLIHDTYTCIFMDLELIAFYFWYIILERASCSTERSTWPAGHLHRFGCPCLWIC